LGRMMTSKSHPTKKKKKKKRFRAFLGGLRCVGETRRGDVELARPSIFSPDPWSTVFLCSFRNWRITPVASSKI
jgi:hypothetical protein